MAAKSGFPEATERLSVKLGVLLAGIPLTPNQWTVFSIVPAVLGFLVLAYRGDMLLALGLFVVSGILDAVDGAVARVTGKTSNFGAYLDGMVDRLVEALLYVGLMLYGLPDLSYAGVNAPMWLMLALLLFFGGAMVSYSRAYADHRKVVTDEKALRRMGGVLERAERLCLVFLGMLAFPACPTCLNYAVLLALALSLVTLAQRVWFVARNAE